MSLYELPPAEELSFLLGMYLGQVGVGKFHISLSFQVPMKITFNAPSNPKGAHFGISSSITVLRNNLPEEQWIPDQEFSACHLFDFLHNEISYFDILAENRLRLVFDEVGELIINTIDDGHESYTINSDFMNMITV